MSEYPLPDPDWNADAKRLLQAPSVRTMTRDTLAIHARRTRQPSSFPLISVVIPARNEAKNIPHVLGRIPASVGEVALVDGASHDATVAIAQALRPDIIIVHQQSRGKGDAIRCGIAASHGDIIVLLDADGSTDPQEIDQFVAPLLAGADFVKGSRFAPGGGSADITPFRRWGNAALNWLVKRLFGASFTDLCYGYNAFWRDCLGCFSVDCDGFEVETQLNLRAHKANLCIVEAPSYEHYRIHGASHLHAVRDGWRILKMIVQERRTGRAVVTDRRYVVRPAHRIVASDALSSGVGTGAANAANVSDVSVVIAAYTDERWPVLIRAVQSVQRQTLKPAEILLVIDHHPSLAAMARNTFADCPEVVILENAGAPGLSPTRNIGVLVARGEYIAFLDDDAEAEPEWLAALMCAGAHERVLGVGGTISPDWRVEQPRWFPEEFGWVVGCGYHGLPQRLAPVRNLIGASMLIRREVFALLGSFHVDLGRVGTLPVGCEETELCVRASQRWPERAFLYEPRARVRHAVPASRATWRYFRSRCYYEGRSKALMARTVGHKGALASEWAYTLRTLPLGIARNLWAVVARRDLLGLARAMAIIIGLALTIMGYLSVSLTTASFPLLTFLLSLSKPFTMRSQHV